METKDQIIEETKEQKEVPQEVKTISKTTKIEDLVEIEKERIVVAKKIASLENENEELKKSIEKIYNDFEEFKNSNKKITIDDTTTIETNQKETVISNDPVERWKNLYTKSKIN